MSQFNKIKIYLFLSFLMHYYFYCNHFYCESGCFSLNSFNFLDDLFFVGIPNWSCKFNNRSNIGLVTLNIESLLHVLRFLCKNCLLRMARQLISFACGSHDSLLLMITPRYFSYVTFFNFDFSILYWCLIMFFLFFTVSILHLSVLSSMPQFLDHKHKASKSDCNILQSFIGYYVIVNNWVICKETNLTFNWIRQVIDV